MGGGGGAQRLEGFLIVVFLLSSGFFCLESKIWSAAFWPA